MGKRILLDNTKNFYKANLHCHSSLSDGKDTPEELKEMYKAKGYSVIAFTDHEHLIDNSSLNDEDFLTLTSAEIAVNEDTSSTKRTGFDMKIYHLNVYSPIPDEITTPCYSSKYDTFIKEEIAHRILTPESFERICSKKGLNDIISECNKRGFLVTLNHPCWSLLDARDYMELDGLWAVEIHNTGCVKTGLTTTDERVFDDMLMGGKDIFCVCGDDTHDAEKEAFGGYVVINSPSLDYNAIFSSLKNGDFYASTGAEINSLVYENGVVKFTCSPCRKVSLCTVGRRGASIEADKDGWITSGEFEIKDFYKRFRLRFEGASGNAYTQSYKLADLV